MKQISLKGYFALQRRRLQLKIAAHVADLKQRAYNKRYYVLPDENNKLRALCKDDVRLLKRMGMMKKSVSHLDIMRECFYFTKVHLNDMNGMTPEERKKKQQEWESYSRKHKL